MGIDIGTSTNWIDLEGACNARDLGGLRTRQGLVLLRGRLIRSDNLQDLTPRDVSLLVRATGLRSVIDLRAEDEVAATGPGPLNSVAGVQVHNLSLFGHDTIGVTQRRRHNAAPRTQDFAKCGTGHCPDSCRARPYRSYLRRSDSIVSALRIISNSQGATIVHCAAGKDRTGVVVAIALALLDVPESLIVSDYARSAERVESVVARLRSTGIYTAERTPDQYTPTAATMDCFLSELRRQDGGLTSWLSQRGWSDADTERLRQRLTSP